MVNFTKLLLLKVMLIPMARSEILKLGDRHSVVCQSTRQQWKFCDMTFPDVSTTFINKTEKSIDAIERKC